MKPDAVEQDVLRAEIAELRLRLEEAEETLGAIRTGQVDALVVGDDIYTLESVDASSNRLRKDVLAHMEDAVVARDLQDHVIYMNPAAERRYAMPASQALGRQWPELCDERWPRPEEREAAIAALGETGHCHTSTLHVTHAGDSFPAESTVSHLRDHRGQVIGTLAVVRDVSAQRRARDQIDAANAATAARERQFATLVEYSPDIVSRFDPALRFIYVNPVATHHIGIPCDAFVGKSCRDLGLPDELCGQWTVAAQEVFQSAASRQVEFRLRTAAGEVRTFEARLIPELGPQGGIESVLSIATDVTERKAAEQALRHADRNKDEFLATLAHELRNPLAPIRNALTLLRLSRDPGVQEDSRKVIERQVTQMVHLVDDLMDISRITQGKVTLRREPVDVAVVIRNAVETSRPLIEARRHALALPLPSAKPLIVEADLTRLIQIVANLLTNAAKYTPEGGRITVSATREGDSVAIAVQDNGPGIAADLLPNVFDMFAQVSLTLERAQGGLGIGLALVKKFTELHGGTVHAESTGPGQGARFTLRLPLALQWPIAPAAGQNADPNRPATGPWRVLVVDDNVDSAESLATLLELMGGETRMAHDGRQALHIAAEFKPHAALLDIGLPLLSGHEVAREIRRQPWAEGTLLIAMSGWGQEDDRRKSKEAGFDHHLVKPIDLDQLNVLLESHRAGRR